jgi:putative hydrolase of the HAD superfamily
MAIRAVLFDLDETLMMEEASVDAALQATSEGICERYGTDPQGFAQAVRQHARQLWRALPTAEYCQAMGIASWEGLSASFDDDDPNLKTLHRLAPDYRLKVWSQTLADYGLHGSPLVGQLAEKFVIERRKRHVLFPDAEPILKVLQRDYQLGLITNGPPDLQREKIQAVKLVLYFQVILISGELGIGKPDSRIFRRALDMLQAAPGEAVMIGDSLHRDILGAHQVGLKGIWINRSGADRDDDIIPDAQIASLNELLSVLKRL